MGGSEMCSSFISTMKEIAIIVEGSLLVSPPHYPPGFWAFSMGRFAFLAAFVVAILVGLLCAIVWRRRKANRKGVGAEQLGALYSGVMARVDPITVTFSALGLKIGDGTHVLRNVTGELRPGEMTAIMGPSGSGKSSFLHAVAGRSAGILEGKVMHLRSAEYSLGSQS